MENMDKYFDDNFTEEMVNKIRNGQNSLGNDFFVPNTKTGSTDRSIITDPDKVSNRSIVENNRPENLKRGSIYRKVSTIRTDSDESTDTQTANEEIKKETATDTQSAKADNGKLEISLVPTQIIRDIAKVRMYGNNKYHSPANWVFVEKQRYINALLRHILEYIDNNKAVDSESGLTALSHAACNIAFLCEMERDDWKDRKEQILKQYGVGTAILTDHELVDDYKISQGNSPISVLPAQNTKGSTEARIYSGVEVKG